MWEALDVLWVGWGGEVVIVGVFKIGALEDAEVVREVQLVKGYLMECE